MTLKSLMSRCYRILSCVALLVLAVLAGGIGSAWAEKRVALVIGNNDYRNVPKLLKAVNDAHTMAETLKQLGFTVVVAENQNRQEFSETLQNFDNALQAGDTAFFFYSGHGFEIMGRNYLLPVDIPAATSGQEELVRDAAISADRIVERLQNRNVRSAILVFDACRNNPFERPGVRALAGMGGLALMQLPEGVFSVFSASPHQSALDRLSDDDSDPNSVFTRIFAKELLKPGLSLVEVAKRTRRSVSEVTTAISHRQVPVYFDQMVDDAFLIGTAAEAKPGDPLSEKEPPKMQQVAAVPQVSVPPVSVPARPVEGVNAPIAEFSRNDTDWSVRLSFVDPPLAISWRLGNSGEFKETGLLDQFDPRTRRRKANPRIALSHDTPASVIEVRYVDTAGVTQGPFPIKFDPVATVIKRQREILDSKMNEWVTIEESGWGPRFFYTNLVEARCIITEARYAIDSEVPDKVLKLPRCDFRDPDGIIGNTDMFVPAKTRLASVKLRYRDGSESEIRIFRRGVKDRR